MNPKLIYENYIDGTPISDTNLIEAVEFFKKLADDLCKCGPVFKLAFKEANYTYLALSDYLAARELHKKSKNETVPVNKPPFTMAEVLNYRYLPKFGWDISRFSDEAIKLGYPYFCWNDRIYTSTDPFNDTGFLLQDLIG